MEKFIPVVVIKEMAETDKILTALKALAAPFPQVKFIPTGGVDRGNIDEFLAFDKVAAIGGSFFVKEALEKAEK